MRKLAAGHMPVAAASVQTIHAGCITTGMVEEYHQTMSGLRVLCEGRHFTMYTCVKVVLEPFVQLEVCILPSCATLSQRPNPQGLFHEL